MAFAAASARPGVGSLELFSAKKNLVARSSSTTSTVGRGISSGGAQNNAALPRSRRSSSSALRRRLPAATFIGSGGGRYATVVVRASGGGGGGSNPAAADDDDAETAQASSAASPAWSWMHRAATASAGAALSLSLSLALSAPPDALAMDGRAVSAGKCLLQSCQLELAGCLADEKCAESLVCLNACFGRPDEGDCQIKCGDLYSSPAVQTFNTCAISKNDCVKQKKDTGEYPVPAFDAMAEGFSPSVFGDKSRWYIVAGLNKDFDIFDCQEHFFSVPDEEHMYVKVNWRVNRSNGQFYERGDVQTFYTDENSKAVLHNNGNEYLHYQDDWYIPGYKEGEYVFVYYRGTNDAWDGYGGAVVYSTKPALDLAYVPELEALSAKVGVKWSDFSVTDNSCKPAPPLRLARPGDLDTLADDALVIEKDIEGLGGFVGKEVTLLESELERDVEAAERVVGGGIVYEANAFKDEVRYVERILEKDLEQLELKLGSFARVKAGGKASVGGLSDEASKATKALAQVEQRVRAEDSPNPLQRLFASLFG